jgi:acyl carrier protein
MDRNVVKETLKNIFHHVAPDIEFDALDLSQPLRDQVEMDSMDFYTVLVQVHKQMGVNVPDSVLMELNHLNALIDYIAANAA